MLLPDHSLGFQPQNRDLHVAGTHCASLHSESWGGRPNKTQVEIDGAHKKACLEPISRPRHTRPRHTSTYCSLCLERTQLSPSHVNMVMS